MCRVLVIEDDAILVQLLKIALQNAGHEVVTAKNGQEGIDKLHKGGFDAVVTDIVMPGMDGNEVALHIRRSENAGLPVIAVTGTVDRAGSDLFNAILKKPFDLKLLLDAVATHTRGPARGMATA
jgi:CheY-like chemotaxis protein